MSELVKSMLKASIEALDAEVDNPPEIEKTGPKPIDLNALTRAFVALRDARLENTHAAEARDRELRAKQALIETYMLKHLNETKADSVATEAGTFYKQKEVTPTGADWDKFYKWIAENNAFDALERRIKKTFIREYMEQHEDGLPPGVSVFSEYVVRVRRSS